MSKRDRTEEISHELPSRDDGVRGPSYVDVRDICNQFEARFACRVCFRVDPEDLYARWERSRMWVRAGAYLFAKSEKATRYRAAALGGNSGTRTMTSAMLAAMLELWDLCEGDAEVDPEIVA
jgi:hypothetical protein